jgi:predicted ArsR family transcriptional regulator
MDRVGDERKTTDRRTTERPTVRRTAAEAAELMGISAEAVRGRIRRGTLPVEREGGAVYVLLEPAAYDRPTDDQPRTTDDRPADRTELVEALRDQISDLRGQLAEANAANRENRRIIAGLTQRIPELEAGASERPEAPETVEEGPERAEPRPAAPRAQAGPRRPWWWRRVFGS